MRLLRPVSSPDNTRTCADYPEDTELSKVHLQITGTALTQLHGTIISEERRTESSEYIN